MSIYCASLKQGISKVKLFSKRVDDLVEFRGHGVDQLLLLGLDDAGAEAVHEAVGSLTCFASSHLEFQRE